MCMSDIFSRKKRSEVMSKIGNKDTGIEIMVRKWLFSRAFRYRKNDSRYPGKPDIVLPKYKTAIFIHGCFWHGHEGCKYSTIPKTRTEFWIKKIKGNIKRDRENMRMLEDMGWNVIVVWGCQLKTNAEKRLIELAEEIMKNQHS